jgi:Flp pilus assembly pilin Flp
MKRVLAAVNQLLRRDDGQDLIEYGLLAVLIAVVVVAGVTTVGTAMMDVFWRTIAQSV